MCAASYPSVRLRIRNASTPNTHTRTHTDTFNCCGIVNWNAARHASLFWRLNLLLNAARGQDEHFACLPQHVGFTRWIHLILRCLVSRSAMATAPGCFFSLSLSLSIWLLFVVILLRKIAHPLGSMISGRLYGDLLRYAALKGTSAGQTTTMQRALPNELRPNTWRNLKTHIILLPLPHSLSAFCLPGKLPTQPEAVNLSGWVQRLPPPTQATHPLRPQDSRLAPLSIFRIRIRKYLTQTNDQSHFAR